MPRFSDPTTQETVGSVKLWTRPNTTAGLPPNWVIADGSTIVDPDSPFNGVAVPNLVDRFPYGAPGITNGSGLGAYESGATVLGGAHNKNLSHTHSMQSHVHNMQSHTHSMQGHTHSITNDGGHNHQLLGPTTGKVTYNPATPAGPDDITNTAPDHNHGGGTGGPSSGNTGAPSSSSTGAPSISSTGGSSVTFFDIRPQYAQMVYIVKIK